MLPVFRCKLGLTHAVSVPPLQLRSDLKTFTPLVKRTEAECNDGLSAILVAIEKQLAALEPASSPDVSPAAVRT